MELFTLHNQWATRPADQRFTSLEDVRATTKAYAMDAKEKIVPWSDLRVEASGDNMNLIGKAGIPATLTHYAFGQLAKRVGAPASYLRVLPPTLAAQNLNFGLKDLNAPKNDASLLFHTNGRLVLRAVTTEAYSRLWNYEVVERLMGYADQHSLVPVRPTFSWSGQPMTEAEKVAATGLYASDHDMVLGLMSTDKYVSDGQSALYRVLIVENSEVGDKSFRVTLAYVRDICGNLILWGVKDAMEFSFPHLGNVGKKWGDVRMDITRYLEKGTEQETALITKAQQTLIGVGRDAVLDALFGQRAIGLSRTALAGAYDNTIEDVDGSPDTVWGFVQGLTRYSQNPVATQGHADKRLDLDRAGRRILATVEF